MVSTEWVAFNDQDDVWLPDKLRKQASMLAAHPDADAVVGGEARLSADGCTRWIARLGPLQWAPQHLPHPKSPPLYNPWTDRGVYLQSLIVRRSALDRIGYFKADLPLADDTDLILRLAEHVKIVALDEPVFLYRLGHHNQTAPGVAKAQTFLAARSYVFHASSERLAGRADPSAADYLQHYKASDAEVKAHLMNQEVRMVNTIWVNRGLWAALLRFFGHSILRPGAVRYVAARLRLVSG
jgi:hypothetical protein